MIEMNSCCAEPLDRKPSVRESNATRRGISHPITSSLMHPVTLPVVAAQRKPRECKHRSHSILALLGERERARACPAYQGSRVSPFFCKASETRIQSWFPPDGSSISSLRNKIQSRFIVRQFSHF
jgi:hypothetical protein